MMTMNKIDVPAIEAALRGESVANTAGFPVRVTDVARARAELEAKRR
jgi:hypothetical protein